MAGTPVEQTAIASLVETSGLRHVAIIMDGNRRWAKARHLPTLMGHKQGVDALKKLVKHASDAGLRALTVYAFSTENWNRAAEEVGYLMRLFLEALAAELDDLHRNNVRIRFIGDISAFSSELQALIDTAHRKTADNTGLCFQVAANYGGRHELVLVFRQLACDVAAGHLMPDAIDEAMIAERLDTAGLPEPDLLIRTGGETRLSNFLMWQSAYSELYITDTLWPDFDAHAFYKAVEIYAERERRYGK